MCSRQCLAALSPLALFEGVEPQCEERSSGQMYVQRSYTSQRRDSRLGAA